MRNQTRDKNTLKLVISFIFIIICLSITSISYANELPIEESNYNEKYIEWLKLSEEEKADTIAPPMYVKNIEESENTEPATYYSYKLGSGSSYYNLRDELKALKVKNQGSTEQCWAFSVTTQLESYMLKTYNKDVEYSPRHLEYSTAKTFLDGTNPKAYNREVNSGGNFFQAYGYLASGAGPILESDMPFVNTSAKIYLSEISGKEVQAQLVEHKVFTPIYKEKNGNSITYTNGQTDEDRVVYTSNQITTFRNEIKSHIKQYGAVGSMTAIKSHKFFNDPTNYLNSKTYNCDDSNTQADHAIVIVGWDDNYDKSNFNEEHRPLNNGAWIVQNSYGTEREDAYGNKVSVFDNGLVYISYEDFLIERAIFGLVKVEDKGYDNIYQYDNLGENAVLPVKSSQAYAANVFEKTEDTEYITQVGIYLNGLKNYTYEIYINNEDDSLELGKLKKVKTISNTDSSYMAVKLDQPIKIEGDKFVIAVKYSNGSNISDVPVEGRITTKWSDSWNTATSNYKESYVSTDAIEWSDMKDINVTGIDNINACIKAFTNTTVDLTLYSSNYTITDGFILGVSPSTDSKTFKSKLTSIGSIKIYTSNNKEVTTNQTIVTGMIVKIPEKNASYTIGVKGDVNGDGKITPTDLLKLKRSVVKLETLSGIYAKAGDINLSGGITATDVLQLKKALCRLINL